MKKLIAMTLLLGGSTLLCAQKTVKIPAVYKPVKSEMYKKGWIDFNKNGVKDVYEDPNASLDARIEDLLSQMTLEEKTCQMVTLYGYKRVLKDDLPTPEWKQMLWKDGIGAIDEHLNGFQQWGLPPSDNPYVWPASRHAWALNEVQRFFIEETRLGIPVDFTNEGIRGVESYRATNFPTQLGLGHTWNRELIRQIGLITGREARMLGYTNVYAPILDVGRDQRWGRYEEVYGESPYLVAELGIEMVRGMQHNHQVAATGKHFIAYSNNKGAREGMARVDPHKFHPRIGVQHDYIYRALNDWEKAAFNRLYDQYYYHRHNEFWREQAMKKLPQLTQSTRMLVCGEDLGMIPDCVAWVMNDLRILSLEIQRMPKDPSQEFGHPDWYPYRSVCTISTHDMSTLRGWWEEDFQQTQRYYNTMLGHYGAAPAVATPELCEQVVRNHLYSNSILCILSLQDWMAMDGKWRNPNVQEERINVPANPRHYWRYRMHLTLEQLMKAESLNEKIKGLIEQTGRKG